MTQSFSLTEALRCRASCFCMQDALCLVWCCWWLCQRCGAGGSVGRRGETDPSPPGSAPAPAGGPLAWFSPSASYINENVMQIAWRCLSEPLAPRVIRTDLIWLARSQNKFPRENKNLQSSQGTAACKVNIQSFKSERKSLICEKGGFETLFFVNSRWIWGRLQAAPVLCISIAARP